MLTSPVLWLVKVSGVRDEHTFRHRIQGRYPLARIGVQSGVTFVQLPQPHWRMMGHGDEGFFTDLCQEGLITDFDRVRVSR